MIVFGSILSVVGLWFLLNPYSLGKHCRELLNGIRGLDYDK